ncbi:helix-turn-helix domain-containing protein [Chloroflexota bacterium]
MENNEFGIKLKELRKQAGISQRRLANKIGVNFSYLSKIESGKMPPPSEQVIIRLAEVLDADKDELLTLAGKIPPDIAQILKNREALQILRSNRTQKKIKSVNNKDGGGTMKRLLKYKTLSKIAVPIVLVLAVAASLWYVAPLPARALEITITPPSTGTHGNAHTFTTSISIDIAKVLPIQTINMEIYNASNPTSYIVTCNDLPKVDGGSESYSTSGGVVTVTASSPSLFAYLSGEGYAYWQGTGYDFGTTFGYGYSTSDGPGILTYSITWTSPSSWPTGDYVVKLTINAASGTLSETFQKTSSSFRLNAPAVDGGGGGTVTVSPGTVNVASVITREGIFTDDVTVESANKEVALNIDRATTGKTKTGLALHTISVKPYTDPPDPPKDSNVIGLTYDMQPDGATFDPPITITFTYDPNEVTDLDNLKIALYDDIAGEWVVLANCVVDPITNTISGLASHFTAFSVLETTIIEEEVVEEEEEEVVEEEEEEVVEEEEEEVVEEEEEEEVVEEEEEEVVEEEEEEEEEPTGIAWWVWVIIGIAVVVAGLLIYFMWWKRR